MGSGSGDLGLIDKYLPPFLSGNCSHLCHILYASPEGTGRIKLCFLKVVTNFGFSFLCFFPFRFSPLLPNSSCLRLCFWVESQSKTSVKSGPRKLACMLRLWNWVMVNLLCEVMNHRNVLSREVTWPDYYLKAIILAVVLTTDLREDVCPGGDGHNEGGVEWLHSEYNLSQLDLLIFGCNLGLPGGTSGKEPTCQCRRYKRLSFHPWVRKISWRRAWQPTPVFLLGESYGQRGLVGYSPLGSKESDTTKAT